MMSNAEKREEANVIIDHISSVKMDIMNNAGLLEELGFKQAARSLNTIAGRLEEWQWKTTSKMYGK